MRRWVFNALSLASALNRASGSRPLTISCSGRMVLAADAWDASRLATSASTDGGMRNAMGVAVADMLAASSLSVWI